MKIRPEQILVTGLDPDGKWLLSGHRTAQIPWHQLAGTYLYTSREGDLEHLMGQAATAGWPILDGYLSDRRGLRGFSVGLGAWGSRGHVEVRGVDAWMLSIPDGPLEHQVEIAQRNLRAICLRLNDTPVRFRASANRWIGSLYSRLGEPWEPDGHLVPLPADVARMARAAHIGGPILHVRSSLAPFVSIDRTRAYGNAMLDPLPVGLPAEIDLGSAPGLTRWRPNDLKRACGLAEATVSVAEGLALPLLPVLRTDILFDRAQAWYPTGEFRGVWPLAELAALEERGDGVVTALHRVVTFEAIPVFAPVIRAIRRLEGDLGPLLSVKRMEHILYGKCSRGLSIGKMGTVAAQRPGLAQDLLDEQTLGRMEGRMQSRAMPLPKGYTPKNPLLAIHGRLSTQPAPGTMERPDRSAIITSRNRIAMASLVRTLGHAIAPDERIGSRIGRIYVDGLEIEATPDQIPPLDGATIRRHGPHISIFRAGAVIATTHDGRIDVEGAGLVPPNSSPDELRKALEHMTQVDQGPFSGGRVWRGNDHLDDPRMSDGAMSEPLHLDAELIAMMGFGATR